MHTLEVILMHTLDSLIRMHILDALLLLLLATTVIATLFGEFQTQSNNAAGSVVVTKTMVLISTTVPQHTYDVKNEHMCMQTNGIVVCTSFL